MLKKQGGFTLIELLVAALILSTGLVAILNTFPVAYKLTLYAQNVTASSALADSLFGRLKNDQVWPVVNRAWDPFDVPYVTDGYEWLERFEWAREVSSVPFGASDGADIMRQVKIKIRFPAGKIGGGNYTIEFYTYVASYRHPG